jgi:hypothetical protein
MIVATENTGYLRVFRHRSKGMRLINVQEEASAAMLSLKDGRTRREEFQRGSGFLSMSGRYLLLGPSVSGATVTDPKGRKISQLP